MKNPNKVVREICFDKLVQIYHVRKAVSRISAYKIYTPISDAEAIKNLGPTGEKLAQALNEIVGVTRITIRHYGVAVEIGRAFDFNEIDPHVQGVLRKVVFDGEDLEIEDFVDMLDGPEAGNGCNGHHR